MTVLIKSDAAQQGFNLHDIIVFVMNICVLYVLTKGLNTPNIIKVAI